MKKTFFLLYIAALLNVSYAKTCEIEIFRDGSAGARIDSYFNRWTDMTPEEKSLCNITPEEKIAINAYEKRKELEEKEEKERREQKSLAETKRKEEKSKKMEKIVASGEYPRCSLGDKSGIFIVDNGSDLGLSSRTWDNLNDYQKYLCGEERHFDEYWLSHIENCKQEEAEYNYNKEIRLAKEKAIKEKEKRDKQFILYSIIILLLIIFTTLTFFAIKFKKISHQELKNILNNSTSKTDAINQIKNILINAGYREQRKDNHISFTKYSYFIWHRDAVIIDLNPYKNEIQRERKMKEKEKKLKAKQKKEEKKYKLNLLDKLKMIPIVNRANDEMLYEYVLMEVEDNIKSKGLWAKAYVDSNGNEKNIEPLYIKYRVQSIKDSLVAMEISYNKMNRKQLFDYIKEKLT